VATPWQRLRAPIPAARSIHGVEDDRYGLVERAGRHAATLAFLRLDHDLEVLFVDRAAEPGQPPIQ